MGHNVTVADDKLSDEERKALKNIEDQFLSMLWPDQKPQGASGVFTEPGENAQGFFDGPNGGALPPDPIIPPQLISNPAAPPQTQFEVNQTDFSSLNDSEVNRLILQAILDLPRRIADELRQGR